MTVVSLKILQVQNWTVFVAKSIMTKVEFVKFLQDILKKQADHLTETLIASRNGRAVLPVKK